jgi:subtilisin family serine protease
MKKTILGLVIGALVLLLQAQRPVDDAAPSVTGELLVQFKAGATPADKARALGRASAQFLEDIAPQSRRSDGGGDLVLVHHQPDFTPAAARRAIAADPAVDFVEPNFIYTHQATSNDPYYTGGLLWGMYGDATSPANQYGSQAGEAWAAGNTGSSTVYVGVIDEGVQWAHQDLAANIWTNPFDPVDGIDNDGNGYKDDIRGWDFDGNNNSTYDGTQDDHGTHVAGTIGAVGGNGVGVAGVTWNVKIITAKFLGRRGGTTANAIKAIDYITDLKTRHGLNIVATNNSWGGGGFSSSLQAAIERANTANILFVAAAGNGGFDGVGDNNDTTPSYPASYTNANIIAVAALTSSGAKATYSNYGATSVDLAAPGSGIYSTLPNSAGNNYGSYSGTSMATPHVTGGAALYAATHPGASAATIKNAILDSAVPTASMSGKCVTGGRLNVSGF